MNPLFDATSPKGNRRWAIEGVLARRVSDGLWQVPMTTDHPDSFLVVDPDRNPILVVTWNRYHPDLAQNAGRLEAVLVPDAVFLGVEDEACIADAHELSVSGNHDGFEIRLARADFSGGHANAVGSWLSLGLPQAAYDRDPNGLLRDPPERLQPDQFADHLLRDRARQHRGPVPCDDAPLSPSDGWPAFVSLPEDRPE